MLPCRPNIAGGRHVVRLFHVRRTCVHFRITSESVILRVIGKWQQHVTRPRIPNRGICSFFDLRPITNDVTACSAKLDCIVLGNFSTKQASQLSDKPTIALLRTPSPSTRYCSIVTHRSASISTTPSAPFPFRCSLRRHDFAQWIK